MKTIVFVLLLIFYGSFLLYQMDLTAADDLPRQMKNGEDILHGRFDILTKNTYSYTEPDQPFGNHHWGSGVLFYLLHQIIGYAGMSIFQVALMLSVFSLLFYIASKKSDFWLVAFLAVPTIIFLLGRSGFRPEMFSYLFIALYLYLLVDLEEHPEHTRIFWLIPVQLAWTNMHIFFVAGILVVGGFLLEKIILSLCFNREGFRGLKNNILVRKLTVLLVCLFFVILVNPFGLKTALWNGLKFRITEESPVSSAETVALEGFFTSKDVALRGNVHVAIFMPMVLLAGLSLVVGFWGKSARPAGQDGSKRIKNLPAGDVKKPIFYLFALTGTAVLGYSAIRGIALFGILLMPALSANFSAVYIAIKKWIMLKWPVAGQFLRIFLPASLIFLIAYFTFVNRELFAPNIRIGIGISNQSENSAQFFKEQGLRGPIFNDTDIGSYIIGALYPQERVFTDNRFHDAYSKGFFKNVYLPLIQDEEAWRTGSDKYNFNVIFANHYDKVTGMRQFLFNRVRDPAWALVYADRDVVIFVKRTDEHRRVIDEFQITRENAVEKLRHLLNSDDSDEMIAGADLLALLGRPNAARSAFLVAVSRWPERGRVWFALGQMELTGASQQNPNPALALLFLQQAIRKDWKTWETYSYLALAYFKMGDIEGAKRAVYEEMKISPQSEDAKLWLEKLKAAEQEAGQPQ